MNVKTTITRVLINECGYDSADFKEMNKLFCENLADKIILAITEDLREAFKSMERTND